MFPPPGASLVAGVVEVPVRVDESFDGIRIAAGESRRNVGRAVTTSASTRAFRPDQ
jgi:hypothetical protein